MTASDADENALDNFNAAIAKAVVNQVAQSDTVKRLQEQQRQFKAGVAAPAAAAGVEPAHQVSVSSRRIGR